jgi:predicted DNA-binding protein (UPF0278 family)
MSNIEQLLNINYVSVILSIFVILFGLVAIFDVVGKISVYIGKPVKWIKKNNEDHEAIIKLTETLDALKKQQDTDREQSIKHDQRIKDDIDKISTMFFDKSIEDMRWRILDFASAISNGRKFNRESYDFIIKTYEQYEQILKEQDRTNGVIDETVAYIKETFREHLRNGDFL